MENRPLDILIAILAGIIALIAGAVFFIWRFQLLSAEFIIEDPLLLQIVAWAMGLFLLAGLYSLIYMFSAGKPSKFLGEIVGYFPESFEKHKWPPG